MTTHSTEPIKELGNCIVCGKPIMMHWKDKHKELGKSELTLSDDQYVVHVRCAKGKSIDTIIAELRMTTIQKVVKEATKAFNRELESYKILTYSSIFIESFAAIPFEDGTAVELEIRFLEKQDITRIGFLHDLVMNVVAETIKEFSTTYPKTIFFTYTLRFDFIKITKCYNLKIQFHFHEIE